MGHQARGLDSFDQQRLKEPDLPALLVGPPGSGKSRMMLELAVGELARPNGLTVLKAHRRMLIEQLQANFQTAGIEYGMIADGYPYNPDARIQLVSSQTLYARAVQRGTIDMPKATLVIDDEAHQQTGKMQRAMVYGSFQDNTIQEGFATGGAYVCGFTASPLMGAAIYQRLINIASYSELRDCGMHQLVRVFGPDEIDTAGLKVTQAGEYSEKKLEQRVQVIFGSVYAEWKKLNPNAYPAILYAPSVKSSRWFAQEFLKKGVKVAHLDGEQALIPEGNKLVVYNADKDIRRQLLEMSKSGEIAMLSNRFVLREAIDMPWIYHGIFATVMGSLTTYLQSVGRLQRFWPAYTHKILQCHGGSYWRHGSPNEDRAWRLGVTNQQAQKERIEKILKGEKPEGIRCPRCGFWQTKGQACLNENCRYEHRGVSVRMVRSVSGTLKAMTGAVYRAPSSTDEINGFWRKILFMCGKDGQSVSSAVAIFIAGCNKRGWVPDLEKLTNKVPSQDSPMWHRKVSVVYPWTIRAKVAKVTAKSTTAQEPVRELDLD